MKNIKYILILLLAVSFFSCEDDDISPAIDTAVAPVISGLEEGASYIFLKENKAEKWITLSWSEADYGFNLATTYTVQFDAKDNAFANALEFNAGSKTSIDITIADINKKLFDAEYLPLTATDIEFRVKASVSDLVTPTYSATTNTVLTIFDAGLPKLYVTGTHQHTEEAKQWDPATAPVVYSANEDENYEGYIYFKSASDEFKFATQPNWDGVEFGGSAGNLDSDDNIVIGAAGMQWVKVDTLAKTYTTEVRNWGVIGSCTPTGWDSDTDMEYNFDTKRLELELTLTASGDLGETGIKFRTNDDWGLNLGDTDGDGTMDAGGTNIAVPEAGTYLIVLDLSTPDYKYELIKK